MEIVILFVLCFWAADVFVDGRSLNASINPKCDGVFPTGNCEIFGQTAPFRNNLVYILSENLASNNSEQQYRVFWSTIGAPTFVITAVSSTAKKDIDVDWTPFLEDLTPEISFFRLYGGRYAALGFASLIEYDDVNNTGHINNAEATIKYSLENAHWLNVSVENSRDGSLIGKFIGSISTLDATEQFNLTLEVRAHVASGRGEQYPSMLFTPGSVSVRVVLDHVPVHFGNSRFALELMFATNDSSGKQSTFTQDKSISDEYSPGVFTVERVGGADTWIQYRPVVYTKTNPGVSDSTRLTTSGLVPITNIATRNTSDWSIPYSLLQGLAGILNNGTSLVRFNISFGLPDDDFYNSTSYQEWTCEFGVGQHPVDVISKNVSLIIAVGFGIPAALIVLGGAYVAYLKLKKRRAAAQAGLLISQPTTNYQTLTDEI